MFGRKEMGIYENKGGITTKQDKTSKTQWQRRKTMSDVLHASRLVDREASLSRRS